MMHDGTGDADAYGVAPPRYRLPAATRLGIVRLQVSDLARAVRFYQDVLGLRVSDDAGTSATLAAHDDDSPLVELHERPGAQPVPQHGKLGLYHFAILLPERAALGRFAAHLAKLGIHPGAADHLVSEALYLNDPDGLGIEVYADRPRASWQTRGRELAMDSLPLDLRALARAGGEQPWTGMPAQTTIGHVHLHVGDITQADAFYHTALGFDRVVWSYPGALFFSAGGYHHHLGTNTWARAARSAGDDDAKLLEWELVLPDNADVEEAAESLRAAAYTTNAAEPGVRSADPWGTALLLRTP